jgi:Na+/H+ antiporter NhaD/arsenite permease-like protein
MQVTNIKSNLMNTILIILVGVALGIFSKLLDNMPYMMTHIGIESSRFWTWEMYFRDCLSGYCLQ